MVEVRGGDLRHHRLQFRPGICCHRPLDEAQVTGTHSRQFARKPLLLLDPGSGGQSIVMLIASVAKLAS